MQDSKKTQLGQVSTSWKTLLREIKIGGLHGLNTILNGWMRNVLKSQGQAIMTSKINFYPCINSNNLLDLRPELYAQLIIERVWYLINLQNNEVVQGLKILPRGGILHPKLIMMTVIPNGNILMIVLQVFHIYI